MFEGEAFVVNTEAMECGGCEVADVYGIFGDVIAEVICFTVHATTGNTSTSHPHTKAAAVVVAAGVDLTLAINAATKLTAPDD